MFEAAIKRMFEGMMANPQTKEQFEQWMKFPGACMQGLFVMNERMKRIEEKLDCLLNEVGQSTDPIPGSRLLNGKEHSDERNDN